MTVSTDQPGIYVGELPPTITFGRCTLSVAYAAFDTDDDSDNLPELRVPVDTRLLLTPDIRGVLFSEGIMIIPTMTELKSRNGKFDFWAIDSTHSAVTPKGWSWKASLVVDKKTVSTWKFLPDSSSSTAINIGESAAFETDITSVRIVLRETASEGFYRYTGLTEVKPGLWN